MAVSKKRKGVDGVKKRKTVALPTVLIKDLQLQLVKYENFFEYQLRVVVYDILSKKSIGCTGFVDPVALVDDGILIETPEEIAKNAIYRMDSNTTRLYLSRKSCPNLFEFVKKWAYEIGDMDDKGEEIDPDTIGLWSLNKLKSNKYIFKDSDIIENLSHFVY